ncbi:MAG: gfo/Idh/MocA family oxidoreductase [Chloroflexi bacterium]|nr:gfo/Idh/MocA family oxidoreductase [Chloroflexota bacterium]
MAEQLRIGVVGANPTVGWASRTHMPALLALPEFDLVAVCTTKRESAEASAAKYEAKRAYWNYRDLVSDPEIDVVDVCVKVPNHHEIVIAALEVGKHVYCEWPLGATTTQALEMAELAAARGLHSMVGLQAYASPSILRLRQLVADGWIGRVLSATMTSFQPGLLQERAPDGVWRADKAAGAHTLSISAGHAIAAFGLCVGPLVETSAIVDTLAPQWPLRGGGTVDANAPDYVAFTGRLDGGGVASLVVGTIPWHGSGLRIEIYGSEGTLTATGRQSQAEALHLQGARSGDAQLADLEVPSELRWIPPEVPDGTPVNVAQMMRRFAESIRADEHPSPTFDDAVQLHRLLDAIERSSANGTSVPLTPTGPEMARP